MAALAPANLDRRAALSGGIIRMVTPMEIGEVICLRGKPTDEIAKLLSIPVANVVTEGAGAVSYIARNNILTSERRDRYQDVVRASGGIFDDFLSNPGPRHGMLQLSHGFTSAPHPALGRVANVGATKSASGLPAVGGDFEFHSSPLAIEIAQLFEGRFMRAGSIGFLPAGRDFIRIIGEDGAPVPGASIEDYGYGMLPEGWGFEFLRWFLLEHSIVPVPANPEALGRSAAQVRAAFLEMPNMCKVLGIDRPRRFAMPYGLATWHKAACPGGHCPGCSGEEEKTGQEAAAIEFAKKAARDGDVGYLETLLKSAEQQSAAFASSHPELAAGQKSLADEIGEIIEKIEWYKTAPVPLPEPDAREIMSAVRRALDDTSQEDCPACHAPALVDRPTNRMHPHKRKDGKPCSREAFSGKPSGLTFARFADLLRASHMQDVRAGFEAQLASGGARLEPETAATQALVRLDMLDAYIREGRVLSAATMARIRGSLDKLAAGSEQVEQASDALSGLLEENTKPQEEPSEESKSTGDTVPDLEPQIAAVVNAVAGSLAHALVD